MESRYIHDDGFLTRTDGNIFALIGAFRKQAKREGWLPLDITYAVSTITAAQNYDEALQRIIGFTEGGGNGIRTQTR